MCNLYSMTKAREAVLRLFRVGHNRATAFEPLRAIFPGHAAPIVRRAEDGERELVTLTWGFVLLRDGYAPKRVTNARDDKLQTPFWQPSFEARRCLVPATSFCEPHDGRKPATWHSHVCGQAQTSQRVAVPLAGTVGEALTGRQ